MPGVRHMLSLVTLLGLPALACAGANGGEGLLGNSIGDGGAGSASHGEASGEGSGSTGEGEGGSGTSMGSDDTDDTAGGEICNGLDDDGDGIVDDGIPALGCGMGVCMAQVPGCDAGVPAQCFPGSPTDELCNGLDDDCDGTVDDELTRSCDSSCGVGQQVCRGGAWGQCDAPPPTAESCNVADDDCNGQVDDGVPGCRVGVHRWWHPTTGEHFYSLDVNEGLCCGFTLEYADYYRLYAAAQPQTVAWYRCYGDNGLHHYTTDANCEGLSVNEGVMGYIGQVALPGSTPLLRSYNPANGDHFFTTSQAEHDNTVDALGFVDEGTVGYVW
ncbi:MAG: hypothetical protein IPH07_01425 [Deltaproteobacteria bacterium]|nr:hypothetical protein [Deltaproteobacteria bacterium]MBP7286045.1 hypothetical protein [Nannocystaceae bacterium]